MGATRVRRHKYDVTARAVNAGCRIRQGGDGSTIHQVYAGSGNS